MQSYLSVMSPDGLDEKAEVDPVLQARFTRAVSALQFLGFIKPSKRKTDHVAKLTWGD